MSNQVVIWHNPRCSKSRATLKLLQDKGLEPEIVEYLKTPPDRLEIERVLGLLGMRARDLMRRKEKRFAELGLGAADVSEAALIAAMAGNPILIERPVVIQGDGAALGRPPEAVLSIIGK